MPGVVTAAVTADLQLHLGLDELESTNNAQFCRRRRSGPRRHLQYHLDQTVVGHAAAVVDLKIVMASTPASVYSSPSRRVASARASGVRPKLCRRWSLDNLSNSKEGYVKDLRKQHQASQVGQRDESYPFMLTERRRGRVNSLSAPISESPGEQQRRSSRPLSSSPPGHLSGVSHKRTRTMSLDEDVEQHHHISPSRPVPRSKRLGSVPMLGQHRGIRKSPGLFGGPGYSSSSVDISTSIVPEELPVDHHQQPQSEYEEANMVNEPVGFLRKRSSSLPRILPPILDRDNSDDDDCFDVGDAIETGGRMAAYKQMDQTSNLIVREMQKFVCRYASDVSQVLPLPLPANCRQQNRIPGGKVNKKPDWKHVQILMKSLAKLHAIGYAIRCKAPGLFQEITASLETVSGSGVKKQRNIPIDLDNKDAMVKVIENHTPLSNEGCYDEIISNVRSQASELYALHTCPVFPVVVHGHLRNLLFRYNNEAEAVGLRLPSLRYACIGSPLLDLYAGVFSNGSGGEATLSMSTSIPSHLQTYFGTFIEVVNYLRVKVADDFSLESLEVAFKKYELTGMILSSIRKGCTSASDGLSLGRSFSVGGKDMLMARGQFLIDNKTVHDLGSDLTKLALDIPFSHEEEDDDDDDDDDMLTLSTTLQQPKKDNKE